MLKGCRRSAISRTISILRGGFKRYFLLAITKSAGFGRFQCTDFLKLI
jgi:hypothetical protein